MYAHAHGNKLNFIPTPKFVKGWWYHKSFVGEGCFFFRIENKLGFIKQLVILVLLFSDCGAVIGINAAHSTLNQYAITLMINLLTLYISVMTQ